MRGYAAARVSNIVGIFAWHPALAKGFMTFNSHLFRSTLSERVRELVTVRACWLREGEYEWAQHVALARTAGLSDEEIDAICEGPDAPIWGPLDAALLRSVDEMVNDRRIGDQTWKQLAEHLDRQQLMDVVFTVGAYDLLCMAFDTFGIELDPGLAGFPEAPSGAQRWHQLNQATTPTSSSSAPASSASTSSTPPSRPATR